MFLFLTFLAYKSLQLRGGHLVYLSRLNENWRVITRTNFLAMRREKHCTNPKWLTDFPLTWASRNPNITLATCFYNCDALSLRNDTIHICSFCACTQKKITDVHAYPDETDSWLFKKLLRYLNVATVIHKWCVLEH